jgi:hypothetical protein
MPRPRFRSLVLSATGVIFVGGVAAAATGTGLSPLLDGIGDTSTTTTTVVASDAATAAGDVPPAWTDEEWAAICDDATNHGDAVSTVAQDPRTTGREHGEAVSAMAHTDCGKTAVDSEEDEQEQQPPTTEADVPPAWTEEEWAAICDDATNHGDAVSTVAKDPRTTGREHGAAVSAMAHSDCGKDQGDSNELTSTNNAKRNKNKNGGVQGS